MKTLTLRGHNPPSERERTAQQQVRAGPHMQGRCRREEIRETYAPEGWKEVEETIGGVQGAAAATGEDDGDEAAAEAEMELREADEKKGRKRRDEAVAGTPATGEEGNDGRVMTGMMTMINQQRRRLSSGGMRMREVMMMMMMKTMEMRKVMKKMKMKMMKMM